MSERVLVPGPLAACVTLSSACTEGTTSGGYRRGAASDGDAGDLTGEPRDAGASVSP